MDVPTSVSFNHPPKGGSTTIRILNLSGFELRNSDQLPLTQISVGESYWVSSAVPMAVGSDVYRISHSLCSFPSAFKAHRHNGITCGTIIAGSC